MKFFKCTNVEPAIGNYVVKDSRSCTRTPKNIDVKSLDESLADCSLDPKCIGVRDFSCKGERSTICYMPNTKKPFPYSKTSCVHENHDRGKTFMLGII